MDTLLQRISRISPVDSSLAAVAQVRLDNLTKPQGSLGRLEELAKRMHCIQASAESPRPRLAADPALIYTVAGDHGVVEEGICLYPQEVTRQMVLNFLTGGAGISVLARSAGADLMVVDAGCLGGPFPEHERLIQRKIAPCTANFAKGPAMDEGTCTDALLLGMDLAEQAAEKGYRVLGLGEMGIGNSTSATALYCAYLGLTPREVASPGANLPPQGVLRKIKVVEQSFKINADAVLSGDPFRILAAVGGLEIAVMAGMYLGAALHKLVVVTDGFISTAAYTAAWKICPDVSGYTLFSHGSDAKIRAALGSEPLLQLGLRLGEGTGAVLTLPILRAAADMYNDMATFGEAGVSSAD
jgi:nicotinate-nucleotide--dimethylbenzimidazole phosphoribosyltransferase